MYRVKVMDWNHNITPGCRYCFTQKTVLRLVEVFLKAGGRSRRGFYSRKILSY